MEEYLILQVQLPEPQPLKFYKSCDEFKQRVKNVPLNKLWNINIQEQLVIV